MKNGTLNTPPTSLFAVVQLPSCFHLFATPRTEAHQAPLSFTLSQSLLRLMSTESVMPSNHLILCHPFFVCLQSFSASGSFPVTQLFACHVCMNLHYWLFFEVGFLEGKVFCCCCHFSRVRLCATPWTAAHWAPPSLGFSRQEYWSGLPFPAYKLNKQGDNIQP